MHTNPEASTNNAESGSNNNNPMLVWAAAQELNDGFTAHANALPYLLNITHGLQRILEDTRVMYNTAIRQRDEARTRLIAAQANLAAVERVVGQYASVTEPVVASDGFTYENVSICEYLQECASSNTKAYSQLTKEELYDVVVPNQTLRRLVQMLQIVRTSEVPPVSQRSPIAPFNNNNNNNNINSANTINSATATGDVMGKSGGTCLNWADEEMDPGATPLRVSELEATLVSAINTGSLNASQCSNNAATTTAAGTAAAGNNNNNNNMNVSNNAVPRRWENRQQQQQQAGGAYGGRNANKKHPCLRVYGYCNFLEDCAFAHYPYEACLNYIKGKCRFGQHCKELHVSSAFPRFSAQRNSSSQSHNSNSNINNSTASPNQAEEKDTSARSRRSTKEKESSKGSSVKGDNNSKDLSEEPQETKPTATTPSDGEPQQQQQKSEDEQNEKEQQEQEEDQQEKEEQGQQEDQEQDDQEQPEEQEQPQEQLTEKEQEKEEEKPQEKEEEEAQVEQKEPSAKAESS
ncbi:hypothetical protein LSM04_002090 [Trypanosoma melophagium]|uniref:uncharacterized protein n=1 Tax=Trypanosoma melophagium TaxID=715481 RepID=UPI00351AAB0F|nr:hypothetical protein LSM04_002090 [Trypanosoma melophagium]